MIKTALLLREKKQEETEEEKKKKKDEKDHSPKRAMRISALSGFAGSAAAYGLGQHLNKKVSHDPENFQKVKDYFKNKKGHSVEYNALPTFGKPLYGYKGTINTRDNTGSIYHDDKVHDPVFLAHEHGHTEKSGKLPIHYSLGTPSGSATKLIGAGITAKMSNSKNKWVRRAGVALPLLATVPHLYEEGRASYHAKKALNDIGYKKDVNSKLLKAHGTYSAQSLIPAAASTYMNYKIKKRRERLMKEEENKKNE